MLTSRRALQVDNNKMFRKPRSVSLASAEKQTYRDPVQLRDYQPIFQGRRTSFSDALPGSSSSGDRHHHKHEQNVYGTATSNGSNGRTGLRKLEYGGLVSPSMHRKNDTYNVNDYKNGGGAVTVVGHSPRKAPSNARYPSGSDNVSSFRQPSQQQRRDSLDFALDRSYYNYPRKEFDFPDDVRHSHRPPMGDPAQRFDKRKWSRGSAGYDPAADFHHPDDYRMSSSHHTEMVSFKPRSRTRSLPPSILKSSINNYYKNEVYDRRASVGANKRTKFKEDVAVYYFITTDVSRRFSLGETDRLKGVPYQSTVIKDDLCMDRPVKVGSEDGDTTQDGTSTSTSPPKTIEKPPEPVRENPIKVKSTDVITDGDKNKKLRLVVQIGKDCLREKTSVKALSGGSTVVVVTYRNEHREDSDELLHQYVEKLALPCVVNAFLVKAHLSVSRELTIEAPVIRTIEEGENLKEEAEDKENNAENQ